MSGSGAPSRRTDAVARLTLAALVLFAAVPFAWAVVASLTPEAALFDRRSLWPERLVLDHYRALFAERAFWLPIRNSLVVAGATTLLCLVVGSVAAYALARLRFRG